MQIAQSSKNLIQNFSDHARAQFGLKEELLQLNRFEKFCENNMAIGFWIFVKPFILNNIRMRDGREYIFLFFDLEITVKY